VALAGVPLGEFIHRIDHGTIQCGEVATTWEPWIVYYDGKVDGNEIVKYLDRKRQQQVQQGRA
jgi:hypothetical protein